MHVTYLLPGDFDPEIIAIENISPPTLERAREMAETVTGVGGNRPFGFKIDGADQVYFIGGQVRTAEELASDPEWTNRLPSVKANGIDRIIVTRTPHVFVSEFRKNDVLLPA